MNTFRFRVAALVLLAAVAGLVWCGPAAARVGAPPVSFGGGVLDVDQIATAVMPPVDHEAYLREDAEREAAGIEEPLRFAAPLAVRHDFATAATLENLPGGGRLWRLRVLSAGAFSLNFGFRPYELPEGATLHFYPADQSRYDGPYGAGDNIPEREFWSPVVIGDDVVIELYAPAGAAFEPRLVLTQVSHDYRGFATLTRPVILQGWCNNDVICPEGDPWRDQIRSEGVFTVNGAWTCSGQLVNSLQAAPVPYFLTAYHCGVTTSNDQTVRVYWNYESPSCGMLSGGSLDDNQLGSTMVARYSNSDFCLLQLTADPDTSFHVYLSGWDARDGVTPSRATSIHHPECDEKAITFNTDPLTVTSYLGTSSPGDGTHWRVDDWEDGTTEPGSSGGGLWNPDKRLVGQLHGGYASCTSITSDWFGRLSRSWTGGGSSGSRLKDWLDPANTGTLYVDGRNQVQTDVAAGPRPAPAGAGLGLAVAPNPTAAGCEIRFTLERAAEVSVEVVDAAGRRVARLAARPFEAGRQRLAWNGRSAAGGPAPAGIYFVRVAAEGCPAETQKLVLVR